MSTRVLSEFVLMKLLFTWQPLCVVFGLLYAGVIGISSWLGAGISPKCCDGHFLRRFYVLAMVLIVITSVLAFLDGQIGEIIDHMELTIGILVFIWVIVRSVDGILGSSCMLLSADSVAVSNLPTQLQLTQGTILIGHLLSAILAAILASNDLDPAVLMALLFDLGFIAFARTIPIAFPRMCNPTHPVYGQLEK